MVTAGVLRVKQVRFRVSMLPVQAGLIVMSLRTK